MERRRRIFSALLLAVFLPAFLASVLHTHPQASVQQPECFQCVHHLPHTGHLSAADGSLSSCVLCHFLGLPFIACIAAVFLLPAQVRSAFRAVSRDARISLHLRLNHSRAPPVFSVVQ